MTADQRAGTEGSRHSWPLDRIVTLVAVVAVAAGFVGWRIGRGDEPSFNAVDVGFLADMTDHHQGALRLSFAYLGREHDAAVTLIARDVILEQAQDIGTMNGLLAEAGDQPTVGDGSRPGWRACSARRSSR